MSRKTLRENSGLVKSISNQSSVTYETCATLPFLDDRGWLHGSVHWSIVNLAVKGLSSDLEPVHHCLRAFEIPDVPM